VSAATRSVAPRIVTPVAAVAAVLLLFELGLRVAGYDPLGRARAEGDAEERLFLQPSDVPGLAYDLVPGFAGRVWGASVRISSQGLRDREFAIPRPPGVRRVAVLGDSITFGNRMALEATYPKRLEVLFGGRVEVPNLGVGGYDTLQEVLRLERIGLGLDPDHVVLGYCINDAGEASVNVKYVERLAAYDAAIYRLRVVQLFAINRDRLEAAQDAGDALDDGLFVARNRGWIADVTEDPEVTRRIERLRALLAGAVDPREHRFLPWYASAPRIGKLRFAFERLAGLAAAHGFDVTVLILPQLDEGRYAAAYAIAYETVRHEAERVGFDVVNVRERFRDAGFESVRANRIHPNERGHEIIAGLLHQHLLTRDPALGAAAEAP
jgi:lysophospholipase L1-like esterase